MKRPTLEDYFHFSRKERTSIILLLILIVITSFGFEIHQKFIGNNSVIVVPPIPRNETQKGKLSESGVRNFKSLKSDTFTSKPVNIIDINRASAESLKTLYGIGPVLSERIVKYRNSRNGFSSKEDLKLVYGITDETFQAIEKRITVSKLEVKKEPIDYIQQSRKVQPKSDLKIDINEADSATFTLLHGIGKKLSSRIVKYRKMSNGFDSIAQLKLVYGIDDELFQSIQSSLLISERNPVKKVETEVLTDTTFFHANIDLDLNKATAEELQMIRGIGPFYSKSIIELRESLGGYADLTQLKNLYKMDDEKFKLLTDHVSIKSPHRKFNINDLEFKELLAMGILEYEEVKYIFNLKRSIGKIETRDQIRNLSGIPDERIELLFKYLEF